MWMWMRDLVAWRRLMWTLVLACWTAGFGPCVCDCMPSVDQVSSSALSLLLSVTSRLSVWAPWAPVCLYVTFCFVMVTGIMLFVDRLCCHVSMDLFLLLLVKCLLFFVQNTFLFYIYIILKLRLNKLKMHFRRDNFFDIKHRNVQIVNLTMHFTNKAFKRFIIFLF